MSSLHCPAIEQLEASLCDVQVQTFCAARGKRGVRVLGGPWVSAWGDLKSVRYRPGGECTAKLGLVCSVDF